MGTVHKLRRQPEGEGGSANHQFLPIMPNMFAYEGGEGGQKFEKSCLRSLWTVPFSVIGQRRLDPGKETPDGFFQVGSQKEYQNMVIISFVHLEKISIFCFMHKSVAQKLKMLALLENKL